MFLLFLYITTLVIMDNNDTSDEAFSNNSLFWSDSSFVYSSDSSANKSSSTVESNTGVVGVRKQKHNTSPQQILL